MKKNNRQFTAPISKAMEAYAGDGALAFHTPVTSRDWGLILC